MRTSQELANFVLTYPHKHPGTSHIIKSILCVVVPADININIFLQYNGITETITLKKDEINTDPETFKNLYMLIDSKVWNIKDKYFRYVQEQ